MRVNLDVEVNGHLLIRDRHTKEIYVDKDNAIHSQNMARILARGLSRESNHFIHRVAFGNGGTTVDGAGTVIFNSPNDGRNSGWEARLYNETYSEIVDENNSLFGTDIGSAEAGNIRVGGGASPGNDPVGGGVVSQEAGTKSNVIITMFLNENEPFGQLANQSAVGPTLDDDEKSFLFDEIGLYSAGKPAVATHGVSQVNVGNKTSDDIMPNILVNTVYDISITIDGVVFVSQLTTPAGGSGPLGELTFGDFCEGINTNAWITAGDQLGDIAFIYITDISGGAYPSIIGQQSFGFLVFQSNTVGGASSVTLTCTDTNPTEFFNVLTSGLCANVNINPVSGANAGVQNDLNNPPNERERLLTHIVFSPILKLATRSLEIIYTLTISIPKTNDSQTVITTI